MKIRKKVEKSRREKQFLPVNKTGKRTKNGFQAHFWVSRNKKKNTVCIQDNTPLGMWCLRLLIQRLKGYIYNFRTTLHSLMQKIGKPGQIFRN